MIATFLALLFFAPDADAARKAIDAALGKLKPKEAVVAVTYETMYAKAALEGKPLVVFVACKMRDVKGALVHAMTEFPDLKGAGIVVGIPYGQKVWRFDMPATATDAEIQDLIWRKSPISPPPSLVPGGIRLEEC